MKRYDKDGNRDAFREVRVWFAWTCLLIVILWIVMNLILVLVYGYSPFFV